jgi:predicted nucleic acid-binding protein
MANSPRDPTGRRVTVLLDTDVLVNWLAQEVESVTRRPLWHAPHRIISGIEQQRLRGLTSLTTLLELRFLLRRKPSLSPRPIETILGDLAVLIEVVIPDEISLLEANRLQAEHRLDPFDAVLLGIAVTLKPQALLSRDAEFLQIASRYLPALTPEAFEVSSLTASSS